MSWVIAIAVLFVIIELFGTWYEKDSHRYLDDKTNKEKENEPDSNHP
jgi:hypothetical protein